MPYREREKLRINFVFNNSNGFQPLTCSSFFLIMETYNSTTLPLYFPKPFGFQNFLLHNSLLMGNKLRNKEIKNYKTSKFRF